MAAEPKIVSNTLLNELNVLYAELKKIKEETGLFTHDVSVNTLLVFSALKQGVNDPQTISKAMFLPLNKVKTEMLHLSPVTKRLLGIGKERKTTFGEERIEVQIVLLPERLLFVTPTPDNPNPKPFKIPNLIQQTPEKPLSKKDKLRKLQV